MPGNDDYERILVIDKPIQTCYTMGVKADCADHFKNNFKKS